VESRVKRDRLDNRQSRLSTPSSSKEGGIINTKASFLNNTEKERLLREDKYYRYKKSGHITRNCPKSNDSEPPETTRKLVKVELEEKE